MRLKPEELRGAGLGGGLSGLDHAVDVDELSGMLERSYEKASRLGEIVGRVTRYSPVTTAPGSEVEAVIDPSVYFAQGGIRIGDYLCIVDPKTLKVILGIVTGVRRADELAIAGVEAPIASSPIYESSPESLITNPVVAIKLLVEGDPDRGEQPAPVSTPIEPQSPVLNPEPGILTYLLSLPGSGVLLGALASLSGPVKGGRVPVRLPYKALLHHTLIIGTTGSGKTSLLKNMASSIASSHGGPIPVILDMNGDFIQLPIGGSKPSLPVFEGVSNPKHALVLVPVTTDLVLEARESAIGSGKGVYESIAALYHREVLSLLPGVEGVEGWSCRRRGATVFCGSPGFPYTLIPYAIDTFRRANMPGDVIASLMPGLTRLGIELVRSLRERFYRGMRGIGYPPMFALLAALSAYSDTLYSRRNVRRDRDSDSEGRPVESAMERLSYVIPGGEDLDIPNAIIDNMGVSVAEAVEKLIQILEGIRPHRGTVEALYRKVQGLIDTGVVDVAHVRVARGRVARLEVFEEPSWRDILSEASRLGAPVVVDLSWIAFRSGSSVWAPRIIGYRVLQSLLRIRQAEWAKRSRGREVLVVIDEAHQFFPQERGSQEEQDANRQVASMISAMARLGRARGIGLVFSTHSPSDLHDIILQLANTKIVLRTEKGHLDRLGVPQELREAIPLFQDRYMAVLSHVMRGGYILAVTSEPLTLHIDFSAPDATGV